MIFWGAIKINSPTKRPPNGARGKRVTLMASAARDALHTLRGTPLRVGHWGREIGVINRAKVVGDWLIFAGTGEAKLYRNLELSWGAVGCSGDLARRIMLISKVGEFEHIAVVKEAASECRRLKCL